MKRELHLQDVKSDLHLGDCLEILKQIPDQSVDLVLTDPPYGMDFQSDWKKDKSKRFPKIINDKKPFIWFLNDAFRVTKNGGAIACFTDWKNQETWRMAIEIAGFQIKSHVIWDRDVHGMGDLKSSFGPRHDVVWFATKGKFSFKNKRPASVIRSRRPIGDSIIHPNEKPIELMESLIHSLSTQHDIVLDPFMGSGSTGVATKNLNRHFIGIEKDENYFEIARKRINGEL